MPNWSQPNPTLTSSLGAELLQKSPLGAKLKPVSKAKQHLKHQFRGCGTALQNKP